VHFRPSLLRFRPEGNTDSIFCSPAHVAPSCRAKRIEAQLESFGKHDRGRKLKASSVRRHIAHGAMDNRVELVEDQLSRFHYPCSLCAPFLLHETLRTRRQSMNEWIAIRLNTSSFCRDSLAQFVKHTSRGRAYACAAARRETVAMPAKFTVHELGTSVVR